MPPLKSLERDYPLIDANFQRFCASHNIYSVEDFLGHHIYTLVALTECENNPKALKEGITQALSMIDNQHQPCLDGMELLEDVNCNKHMLSTGCHGIDVVLGGGLRQGQLTEIVGPSSSGKTQICLRAASYCAERLGVVMFLDSCNSFSPSRIAHIVGQLSGNSNKEDKERRLERIMSRILCRSVFDIFELLDALDELEFASKRQIENQDDRESKLCLLIIDSISSLIAPTLGSKSSQGRMLMVSAGTLLKKLANEHNLSVLVTNHMVSGEGGVSKPALGESWKSIPHVQLLVSRVQESSTFTARILKHTLMASGRITKFAINE